MKTLLSSIFLLAGVAISQASQIRGVVSDSAANETLPYATIQLQNSHRGTIANADGEFLLSVDSFPVSIVVSYVGYKTDSLALILSDTLKSLQIFLEKKEITLPEVMVTLNDPFAVELIKRAFDRINSNKDNTRSGKAYYRGYAKMDTVYTEIFEIFYDALLTPDGITDVAIEQGRFTQAKKEKPKFTLSIYNLSEFSTKFFKLIQRKEPFYSFLPFVKKATAYSALREDAEEYFYFKTEGFYTSDGSTIAIIQCTPQAGLDRPAFQGTIEIDTVSAEVIRLNEIVSDERLKPLDFNWQGYYPTKFKLSWSAKFSKDESGNRWLNFLKTEFSFELRKEDDSTFREQLVYPTFIKFYEYRNNMELKEEQKPQDKEDIVNILRVDYNPDFWKAHENIFNEVPIEESVKQSFLKRGFYGNVFPGGEKLP